MACDICGKTGVPVESLLEQYATADIQSVCSECSDVIAGKNSKLLSMVLKIKADLLKRFMAERRAGKRLALQAARDREAARAGGR
jgi:hypothetical protein